MGEKVLRLERTVTMLLEVAVACFCGVLRGSGRRRDGDDAVDSNEGWFLAGRMGEGESSSRTTVRLSLKESSEFEARESKLKLRKKPVPSSLPPVPLLCFFTH
jgi:hypothetical protein